MPKKRTTLRELKDTFLGCRMFVHPWDYENMRHERILRNSLNEVTSYVQVVDCLRCGMGRKGKIAVPSQQLIGTYSYIDPPGEDPYYLQTHKGGPRTTKADIRGEWWRRNKDLFNEPPAKKAPAKKAARGRPITRKTTTRKRSA